VTPPDPGTRKPRLLRTATHHSASDEGGTETITRGDSNQRIGEEQFISPMTMSAYMSDISGSSAGTWARDIPVSIRQAKPIRRSPHPWRLSISGQGLRPDPGRPIPLHGAPRATLRCAGIHDRWLTLGIQRNRVT